MDEDLRNTQFYSGVPKGLVENLIYREVLLELADEDQEFQRKLWIACCRDELFWINSFLWIFEPREAVVYPFVTWQYQDGPFLLMDQKIGKEDFGAEKSRDMGVTWMVLVAMFYRWLFRPRQTFGLVTLTEDKCDSRDDPDTLFWKLDFLLANLPWWMKPKFIRTDMSLTNRSNHSTFHGHSCTGDVGRGGRKTAFMMDEMGGWPIDRSYHAWASTQHVTNCRIMVSTPMGMAGAFAETMRDKSAKMTKISLHWAEHPQKQRGLYRSTAGILDVIDTDYKFPIDYPFITDGKLRSPWYDEECRRHPVPALIAQELDIDYGGSGFPFFKASIVEDHARQYACPAFKRGELEFSLGNHEPEWIEVANGKLFLWINLTADGAPPRNADYVIGCDISTGIGSDGSTNSVASVVNKLTGEKVAELCANDLFPDRFADYVIALRKFFKGPAGEAFVIWEQNGPGLQFGRHFTQISPYRIYYKQDERLVTGKRTRQPGWFSGKAEKRLLLGEYGKAIERGQFINHSGPALDEMLYYVHFPDGSVDHTRAKSTIDPTAAGENHGDRVIADAVAYRAVGNVGPRNFEEKEKGKIPYGSMAWRMQLTEKKREEVWL